MTTDFLSLGEGGARHMAPFLAEWVHDSRTPLAVIKQFSSIILEGLAGPVSAEQAEFLAIIVERTSELESMVETLARSSSEGAAT
jgi:signal transduction histidine kinase